MRGRAVPALVVCPHWPNDAATWPPGIIFMRNAHDEYQNTIQIMQFTVLGRIFVTKLLGLITV